MSRLSRADMRYFQKARQAAEISDYKRTHVGCVAVYQGNIIGIACNTNKTHPMQKYYNRYRYHPQTSYFYPKLHAEINCISSIRHLDINFSKVKLYVYRTRCDQEWISYFCFELDYGEKWKAGTIKDENDNDIVLQTAENLYELLMRE